MPKLKKKIYFGSQLLFLETLNPNGVKKGAKKVKSFFYKSVLESVLPPISTVAFSIFSEKVKIVVPYWTALQHSHFQS